MAIDQKEIGMRIRKKRGEVGLNQKDLAEKVGISPSAINQFEKGDKVPSTETIMKLARELGASTDYLLGAATDDDIFIDSAVVDAFKNFRELSAQDRHNIVANIKFLKDNSPVKK